MVLLGLGLTCGMIYNRLSQLGRAHPWDQSTSARGECGGGDSEGWFYSKILKGIYISLH